MQNQLGFDETLQCDDVTRHVFVSLFNGVLLPCLFFLSVSWQTRRHEDKPEPWWPRKSGRSIWRRSGIPNGRRSPNATRTLWSIVWPGGWWSIRTSPGSGRAGTAALTPVAGPRPGRPGTKSPLCPSHRRRPRRQSWGRPAAHRNRLLRTGMLSWELLRRRTWTRLHLQARKLFDNHFPVFNQSVSQQKKKSIDGDWFIIFNYLSSKNADETNPENCWFVFITNI